LGITETNLAEREGKFLLYKTTERYVEFWSSIAENKKKRSGVGLLIEEQ